MCKSHVMLMVRDNKAEYQLFKKRRNWCTELYWTHWAHNFCSPPKTVFSMFRSSRDKQQPSPRSRAWEFPWAACGSAWTGSPETPSKVKHCPFRRNTILPKRRFTPAHFLMFITMDFFSRIGEPQNRLRNQNWLLEPNTCRSGSGKENNMYKNLWTSI